MCGNAVRAGETCKNLVGLSMYDGLCMRPSIYDVLCMRLSMYYLYKQPKQTNFWTSKYQFFKK